MSSLYDISVPVNATLPVWPGDQPAETLFERGEHGYGSSQISTTLHVGTHIDAPAHVVQDGPLVETIALQRLIGTAWVAEVAEEITHIGPAELEQLAIPTGTTRMLLKTANSRLWAATSRGFEEDYTALTTEGARWIVDHGMDLVGIDYLSIQRYDDPGTTTHLTLLGKGVIILEGLDLTDVPPGEYELLCLPWKVTGVCGAPVRAVLRGI